MAIILILLLHPIKGVDKMAQIRRRSPNTYTISVLLGRDKTGKRKFHNETFHGNLTQARRRGAELETELKKRCGPKGADMTVGELMDRWLEEIKESLYIRTFEKYAWHVRRLKPLIGDFDLYTLTSLELQQSLKGLEGLANRTKRDLYATVRTILRQAQSWGITNLDLSAGLRKPKKQYTERHVLSLEELSLLIEAAKKYKHYLPVRVLALSGVRIGEVLGLKWQSINFEKGTITIEQAADIKRRTLKETKTKASCRKIKLDKTTILELQCLKEKVAPVSPDELVFRSEESAQKPIRYNSIRNTLVRALKAAGLRGVRIHDLRHSVGSILLDEGVPIVTVADVMGQSVDTLARIYAHKIHDGEGVGDFLEKNQRVDQNPETK